MAEIINLRQVRKQKARAAREEAAEANRRKFGQSKADKKTAETDRDNLSSHVDSHKLDPGSDHQD